MHYAQHDEHFVCIKCGQSCNVCLTKKDNIFYLKKFTKVFSFFSLSPDRTRTVLFAGDKMSHMFWVCASIFPVTFESNQTRF